MEQEFFHIELTKSVHIAVPLTQTAEVLTVEASELCPIPGVAPALLGVVNQRGRLLWMVDLEYLLGLQPTHSSKRRRSPALVVNWLPDESEDQEAEYHLGCLTSHLRGIVACQAKDISPVPPRLEQRMHQFFSAWIHPPGYSLLKLNVEAIFTAVQLYSSPTSMALL
ncbi:chemotaxis protein CheW [Synechococcus sp. PCC 6312]|uniref:chemotaxis protein CheW n=1 Tax=Synechococcus sp. (strain ATCC 27167 / PCC 6312) TaxID=195253 RepID=UPI00029EC4D4|nr:chemotaxis protein CheW [Synechococcus sp. PCC 6312]AFY62686.1 chemotaxis signal transduction protein [Synechococcus sp. PCC 6312]